MPWTYPGGRLGVDPLDITSPDGLVCFFLPMTDWHSRIQRSQQLAKALAASGTRAYVNPTWVWSIRVRIGLIAIQGSRNWLRDSWNFTFIFRGNMN